MAGIIHKGSRLHNLHLNLLKGEKKVAVPERKTKAEQNSEIEELLAMKKEDLAATAELENVDFKPADTKEVIANSILEKRKTTE